MGSESKALWLPYTQMKNNKNEYYIEKGDGVYIYLNSGEKLIDTISSWWAAIHGYNNQEINQAIIEQMSKVSHFMLGGVINHPAEDLAEKLVEITPKGLNHVFFSDSGSVGVEAALKMAAQYWHNKGHKTKKKFIALKKAYHGDTFKAMEAGDDFSYHSAFSSYFKDVYHVSTPEGGFDAKEDKISKALKELKEIILLNKDEISAFILEPVAQCAGGFNFYSPEYINKAYEICKQNDILMIFDEVATGFGRTGKLFAAEYTNIIPDIMILGKALTAGYMGHAATITTTEVFEGFYGDNNETAFMHGPTFMGNALVCAAGLKSIEIFFKENYLEKIKNIENYLKNNFILIKSKYIKEIRVLGTIAVIEVTDKNVYKNFKEYAVKNGIWIRPFANYIYIMPPYIIKESELEHIIDVIKKWFLIYGGEDDNKNTA